MIMLLVSSLVVCYPGWDPTFFFIWPKQTARMALQSRFKDESWKGTFESAIPGSSMLHFHIIVAIINTKDL